MAATSANIESIRHNSGSDIENIDLLHPEILPVSTLLRLFESRCFDQDRLQDKTKEELLVLFHEHLIPLPQREYRNNRRGTLLKKLQESCPSRKRRKSDADTNITPSHVPIKLARTVTATSSSISDPVSTSVSTIKVSDSSSSSPSTQDKNNSGRSFNESGRKMIKLINDTLKSSSDGSSRKDRHCGKNRRDKDEDDTRQSEHKSNSKNNSNSTSQESVKKKHKPITWP